MSAPATEPRSHAAAWDADRLVTELYACEYRSLVRLAVLLVHNVPTAEELVQDAFAAMHGGWRRPRNTKKALFYLRRAVVRRSRSVLSQPAVAGKNAPDPASDGPGAEQGGIALLERSPVVAAVRMLPGRRREAIVLRYYAGLSDAQIAAAMGVSGGSVKSHTARGMSSLRPILDQQIS
jgi:RNA polymerase sigma-70 factor (sigma-E family)